MYTYRQFNGGDGEFKSLVTGKTYSFKGSRDSSDKRRAKAEMEAEHRQIRETLTVRLGREPTSREMMQGVAPEDTRPLREQIHEDGMITSNPSRDPAVNPYAPRLAELQSQKPLLSSDKAKLKRRIEMVKRASDAWEANKTAEREAAEAAKRMESDLLDAQTNVNLTKHVTGFTADDVRIAQTLLTDLEVTGDVQTYRRERNEWEAQVKARREQAAQVHEEAAKQEREQAALIRAGEAQ